MTRTLAEKAEKGYDWIDVTDPQPGELEGIARQFHLHESSVQDCLQPGHLPKYEEVKEYTFVILRVYSQVDLEADTVQEITNKIAVFIGDGFIITIHRKSWAPLDRIASEGLTKCKAPSHILTEILKAGLRSFDEPGHKLAEQIEYYETQVFLTERKVSLLKGLYFIKRKVDVIRRLLLLTHDLVDELDPEETSNAYTRDVRDLYVKQKSLFDALSENTNHLLNVYFNISAQRTNEIMRVLTVFSVFFMPLTFIVGIYGMNFQFMPELSSRWGYPMTLTAMAIVVVLIYIWFKKKKWL